MTSHESVIAWLVPTARGTIADKAVNIPENFFKAVATTSAPYLDSRLPNLILSRPQNALQITFDQTPTRPGRFTLGTDPRSCDIILPALPGVARQHCALSFDHESRLTLEDFSEKGTQVWFDWESIGDKVDYTWTLSGTASQRITIDIQGLRFQLIMNDYPGKDASAYKAKVDTFCTQPPWGEALSFDWERKSVAPVLPLFTKEPLFRHIFVKGLAGDQVNGEIYLWNTSKPWEPMVKAVAAAA
jgi:hypothetical protein